MRICQTKRAHVYIFIFIAWITMDVALLNFKCFIHAFCILYYNVKTYRGALSPNLDWRMKNQTDELAKYVNVREFSVVAELRLTIWNGEWITAQTKMPSSPLRPLLFSSLSQLSAVSLPLSARKKRFFSVCVCGKEIGRRKCRGSLRTTPGFLVGKEKKMREERKSSLSFYWSGTRLTSYC